MFGATDTIGHIAVSLLSNRTFSAPLCAICGIAFLVTMNGLFWWPPHSGFFSPLSHRQHGTSEGTKGGMHKRHLSCKKPLPHPGQLHVVVILMSIESVQIGWPARWALV